MNDKTETPAPPYVAYKTFKNFIRSIAHHMPSRIDKSVMGSMSGGSQSQVLHALRYLDLIDYDGTPKDKLVKLSAAEGEPFQELWAEILDQAYPFLGDADFDLTTATTSQLDEKFGHLAKGDTVRKCKTFFLPAAKDAGWMISPYIKDIGKRSPSTGKSKRPRAPRKPKSFGGGETQSQNPPPPRPPAAPSWHQLLLEKFPSFDPSWPDEVKQQWLASFNDLMKAGKEQDND